MRRNGLAGLIGCLLLLPTTVGSARERVDVEAVAGEPFGVAIVRLPILNETGKAAVFNAFAMEQREGRVHYPAFIPGKIRRVIGELIGLESDGPAALTVSFLFDGETPFRATIYAPQPIEVIVTPQRQQRRGHQRKIGRAHV